MIRVIIADDNEYLTKTCCKYLSEEKEIEIIDIVNNGVDALNSYLTNNPDVLLLDLDMPGLNGLEIIDKLSENMKEKKKNNIIVISGKLEYLFPYNTSKVYRIMPKPLDFDKLIDTIYEIKEILNDTLLEEQINDYLLELKLFSPSLKGLDYLKKAIFYCYKDETNLTNITNVYEMIARDYKAQNITAKKVLYSLESLVDAYCRSINKEFLLSVFTYYDPQKHLSPKYLIELIVVNLKLYLKEKQTC